ncbi:LOW QUALITY PROTEIN: uncharacterized protein LOC135520700 [Oncorhynchus masou masou]|uniref:LOW QUALITY PROTEIN: uncharacterized protein LOC135520700 n=1 Tax=Oncorhynchus masou masou TaxID=90313 RepID=UPI003182D863
MHSSSRTFAPPLRPRRIDTSRRTTTAAEPKPHGPVSQREDKNMNTISSSSPRRATKATPESSRTRVGVQPRAPLGQSRLGLQRNTAPLSTTKPKSVRAAAVSKRAPLPPPLPHLDPNCNEPSLPCLCCDGHSPQDNNSLFNHNHNNNNTISIRQQLKLQPPPPPPLLPQRQEGTGGKTKTQASPSQPPPPPPLLPQRQEGTGGKTKTQASPSQPPPPPPLLPQRQEGTGGKTKTQASPSQPPPPPPLLPQRQEGTGGKTKTQASPSQPPPPPPLLPQRQEGTGGKTKTQASPSQPQPQVPAPTCPPNALELEKGKIDEENADVNKNTDVGIDNKKETEEEEENSVEVDDEEEGDDDDDTLVPSCCDCPPSLLDLSLTSSTSSTSISSCSDLESDCADLSTSLSSSGHKWNADLSISQDHTHIHVPEHYPASRSPPVLLLNPKLPSVSRCPSSPPPACSPDEGYPSAPASPDYLGVKGQTGLGSEVTKLGLLDFLESVGDFGKMERFSQVIQVVRWDLEGDPQGDLLRDRLDHLDRLESVNRQVKLAHFTRLHEKGLDLGDLGKEDLSDVLDEMGNVDMSWKLYKGRGRSLGDSQEFSDAGVDLTAPSDCDEPLVSQSETSSPIELPPRPPKPPARYASVNSELHTYINISRDITPSVSVCTSPSSSPTFYTFRCEKALPPSPRSVPPPLLCQPIPYFTLYKSSPLPFSLPSSTPPIPPPRRKHLARKEAQRLATLQAGCGKTPLSLSPPTSRLPPFPPAPTISISNSTTPPAIPPPPSLPPPPSFHALDDEIRKLLVLAGLTQAELLKLSPELGVCVGGLEEEVEGETHHTSRPGQTQDRGMRRKEEKAKEQYDIDGLAVDGWRDGGGRSGVERDRETDIFGGVKEDEGEKEESRDVFRTTSFTDMARRRKRNSVFGANVSLASDSYYSTGNTNTSNNVNFETFKYSPVLSETPPPPPPRPLPPVPPTLPPLKVCTLLANSLRPERFDWLMAFSPDGETLTLPPPLEVRKSNEETLKKSTSGSTSGSSSKVMTFKELRNRSKHSSPAYQLITEPDPDPTVITPDPDFLYNLKWRREKTDSDGIQWEYTSQAQATFLQPPPLTSLAAFREMFQKAEDTIGQPELCPSQRIGCSASEGNLWRMDGQRKEEGEKRKEEVEEEEVEVRGTADGGRTWESRTTAVCSVSFAGSVQRGGISWMGDDVKAPLRGLGLSSLCLLEKRALVSAVSVAVEAILAQFSSSRTLVQKALSGDSSVNPSLGRLVLQCLCPALRSLLSDGLKPHQSDLISGRRPNSAWGLVQASTRPGPSTQSLYSLQARIGELPQLRQNKHRFNAFLLGLLNIKLMDFWLSHLQSCSDVLVTFYQPSSFMRLSLTSCQPLFEELLLLLQPLSLLTLNLDLLFQHHHLDPANHSPEIPSPPNQDLGFRLSPRGSASQGRGSSYLESLSELDFGRADPEATNHNVSSSSLANSGVGGLVESLKPASLSVGPAKVSGGLAETSPQLMWVQEKEIRELAPPNVEEASLSQQAGQVIQQGWGLWYAGGASWARTWLNSASEVQNQEGTSRDPPEPQTSTQARSDPPQVDGALAVPWGLGRLFGASNNPTIPTLPTRRPSQWLSPGVSVLTRMVSSSSSANQRRALEPQQVEEVLEREMEETWDNPRPLRSVRTLCDHSGTGAELSFQKGEELVVLGGVDHDWIRCRQGDREGLVPIGYASLIL